jgi:hypothetical protein
MGEGDGGGEGEFQGKAREDKKTEGMLKGVNSTRKKEQLSSEEIQRYWWYIDRLRAVEEEGASKIPDARTTRSSK